MMIDLSTEIAGDDNIVAGGFKSKAVRNPKDNSSVWKLLIIVIAITIIVGILTYTGQLDKALVIGEGIARLFGR